MGRIHLSFDNGPDPVGTPMVLRTLSECSIQASFFVLGKHLETAWGMALCRRIRDEGHRLGNHSYSHQTPLGDDLRPLSVELELQRTQELLDQVWEGEKIFRPFGGGGVLGPHLLSPKAVDWLSANEATCVLWNAVPGDWLDPKGWVEKALAQVQHQAHSVVVLHDVVPAAMEHLGDFVQRALAAGHSFTLELPQDCLPMRRGVAGPELAEFVQQP